MHTHRAFTHRALTHRALTIRVSINHTSINRAFTHRLAFMHWLFGIDFDFLTKLNKFGILLSNRHLRVLSK